MINNDKWLSSLPKNKKIDKIDQLDPNRWVSTIAKKNTFTGIQKYSFIIILSHVISAKSLYDHTKLLLVGIIWYIIERSFSQPDRIHNCTTINNVYKNTSKPRYDDILFNTFGQIIYIISKLPMK